MFIPVYGICICHNKKRLIVVKAGFCKIGNNERKKKSDNSNRKPDKCHNKSVGKRNVFKSLGHDANGENERGRIHKTFTNKTTSFSRKNPTKIKKKFKKATGEGELFKSIGATTEEPNCQVCRTAISILKPHNFSHLLAKSTYSIFRLLKANIWICCFECHGDWDFGDRSQPKFEEKRKEAFLLKQFYYSLTHEQRKSGIEWLTEAFRTFKANAE